MTTAETHQPRLFLFILAYRWTRLLPALWLFALYVSAPWAALLGAVYLVGRVLYFVGYVRDPARRELGFGLSMVPVLVLLIGALAGAAMASM